MMKLRHQLKNPEKKKTFAKTILATAVLVSGLTGCTAFHAPRRTETICSSQGMVTWDRTMEEHPEMLSPEDREFLLHSDYMRMRCVTVEVR